MATIKGRKLNLFRCFRAKIPQGTPAGGRGGKTRSTKLGVSTAGGKGRKVIVVRYEKGRKPRGGKEREGRFVHGT